MYSFIQEIFIEHLLCARHWEYETNRLLSQEGKSLGKIEYYINHCASVGIVGEQSRETATGTGIRLSHFKESDVKAET